MSSKQRSVAFVFVQKKGLKQQYQKYQKSKKSKRSNTKLKQIAHRFSNDCHPKSHKLPFIKKCIKHSKPSKDIHRECGFDYFFETDKSSSFNSTLNISDNDQFPYFRFSPQPISNIIKSKPKHCRINPLNKFTSNTQEPKHKELDSNLFKSTHSQNRKSSIESIELLNRLHRLSHQLNHKSSNNVHITSQQDVIAHSPPHAPIQKDHPKLSNKSTQTIMQIREKTKVPTSIRKRKVSHVKPEWIIPQVEMKTRKKRNDTITPKITELSVNRHVTHTHPHKTQTQTESSLGIGSIVDDMIQSHHHNSKHIDHSYPKSDLWSLQATQQNIGDNHNGGPIAWSIPMGKPCKIKPKALTSRKLKMNGRKVTRKNNKKT